MALDVRRLKVLREVAARGSFSAAADALAFTQPSVSRQIATLEAEAGTRLVDRTARGVRLTPAGELLVEHADVILGRLAAAEAQLEALAELDAGRLRLGAFPTASATLTAAGHRRLRRGPPGRGAAARGGPLERDAAHAWRPASSTSPWSATQARTCLPTSSSST